MSHTKTDELIEVLLVISRCAPNNAANYAFSSFGDNHSALFVLESSRTRAHELQMFLSVINSTCQSIFMLKSSRI